MRTPPRGLAAFLAVALVPAAAVLAAEPGAAMVGFESGAARSQAALEARFDAQLDAAAMRRWLEQMSAEPNHVGSAHDRKNAEFMLAQFRTWGWDARIETFNVLYPTPKRVALELVAPRHYSAGLVEPPLPGDRSSSQARAALPPYNVYGADGDVTGQLVYVNYGMPDDYKELARRNVSVRGRIVIVRYGGGWRGLKPKLAHEHGAIGCIIYSDPRDDGYGAADPYPHGAGRPAPGLQRGSVADTTLYPGDPLTPGVAATRDAPRLERTQASSLLRIPVLPISFQVALPFLVSLAGPSAPAAWRGGLPFTYHIGPGPARAHLTVSSDWAQHEIYDVVARIDGSVYPDQWILRGNHHDAWVFGAADPLSGNVALMAEVKAIGALVAGGWRPKRTLIYASWDAEEPGLVGSTEWVEAHAEELARKAVAYVNSDANSHGFLRAGGSPALQRLVNEAAAAVEDPSMAATVLARARARAIVAERDGERSAKTLLDGGDLPLEALGSGSDYTPFLQHAGIATLNLGFANDEPSGVYHSVYDSFDHYVSIEDPQLRYGVTLAAVAGRVMLRLADADLVPLRAQDYAAAIARYVDEIDHQTERLRQQTQETDRMLDQRVYELAASASDPVGPPPREADVPYLNFAPLKNAAAALASSAKAFDAAAAAAIADPARLTPARAAAANALLGTAEQALLGSPGLPGRPWFRHMVYAPGRYTGYGAKTLPAVREAVEERRWADAAESVTMTAAAIDSYRRVLEAATAALR